MNSWYNIYDHLKNYITLVLLIQAKNVLLNANSNETYPNTCPKLYPKRYSFVINDCSRGFLFTLSAIFYRFRFRQNPNKLFFKLILSDRLDSFVEVLYNCILILLSSKYLTHYTVYGILINLSPPTSLDNVFVDLNW